MGYTLMNAMTHVIPGIDEGDIFFTFGFGNIQNITDALLCLAIPYRQYIYKYGRDHYY